MDRPLGKNTIIIVRAPLVVDTRDNTPYRNWAGAVRTTIRNCMVEPFPLAEKLNFETNKDREFAQSSVRIYAPPATDVVYTDRIEFDDETYQVLGHPGFWYDFKAKKQYRAIIAQLRAG